MDAEQFRLLGFPCQHKPSYCRGCNVELIPDKNWTKGCIKSQNYWCKQCNREKLRKWRENNLEYAKEKTYKNNRTVLVRYKIGKKCAKQKNYIWTITLEEYTLLVSNSCHYCTHPLPEAGGGLDQKVAGGGYTLNNVVPCCEDCNRAKGRGFTDEEMLLIGKVIKEIKEKRKISKDLS